MTIARSAARSVARPAARPVTGGLGGGGAAPSLDILASVGTSTSPTSTGTKAVTGVGFQPKVVLPFGSLPVSVGVSSDYAMASIGAMTQSAQAGVSAFSLSSQTTSSTTRRHTGAAALSSLYQSSTLTNAAFSAFGVDGFTLDWTSVHFNAYILNHIALGGADLEVSLTQHQMNGTNAAQSFAHGLSGAPTGVLFFSVNLSTAPATTAVQCSMGIGAWAGGNQFVGNINSVNGVTTTDTKRVLSTTAVVAHSTSAAIRWMAVDSVDATNVNVTYPVTGDATQRYFFMLAIRGAKCQVGTFNTASSNTIVTTGITPKLFMPVFVPTGVGSVGSVLNDLMLTIGASDGTNNVSCGISDENGKTGANSTNARRFQSSTTLCEYNVTGTKSFEATAAFSGESVVITPTTALTNFGQSGYMVIGS